MEAKYKLTHGEAISIGMLAATKIAIRLKKCDQTVYDRLHALIERAGLPVSIPSKLKISVSGLLNTMKRDKKAVGGTNRFVLPLAIGDSCKHDKVSETLIAEVVKSCFTN
jgi:3-dehydroquinate synthase